MTFPSRRAAAAAATNTGSGGGGEEHDHAFHERADNRDDPRRRESLGTVTLDEQQDQQQQQQQAGMFPSSGTLGQRQQQLQLQQLQLQQQQQQHQPRTTSTWTQDLLYEQNVRRLERQRAAQLERLLYLQQRQHELDHYPQQHQQQQQQQQQQHDGHYSVADFTSAALASTTGGRPNNRATAAALMGLGGDDELLYRQQQQQQLQHHDLFAYDNLPSSRRSSLSLALDGPTATSVVPISGGGGGGGGSNASGWPSSIGTATQQQQQLLQLHQQQHLPREGSANAQQQHQQQAQGGGGGSTARFLSSTAAAARGEQQQQQQLQQQQKILLVQEGDKVVEYIPRSDVMGAQPSAAATGGGAGTSRITSYTNDPAELLLYQQSQGNMDNIQLRLQQQQQQDQQQQQQHLMMMQDFGQLGGGSRGIGTASSSAPSPGRSRALSAAATASYLLDPSTATSQNTLRFPLASGVESIRPRRDSVGGVGGGVTPYDMYQSYLDSGMDISSMSVRPDQTQRWQIPGAAVRDYGGLFQHHQQQQHHENIGLVGGRRTSHPTTFVTDRIGLQQQVPQEQYLESTLRGLHHYGGGGEYTSGSGGGVADIGSSASIMVDWERLVEDSDLVTLEDRDYVSDTLFLAYALMKTKPITLEEIHKKQPHHHSGSKKGKAGQEGDTKSKSKEITTSEKGTTKQEPLCTVAMCCKYCGGHDKDGIYIRTSLNSLLSGRLGTNKNFDDSILKHCRLKCSSCPNDVRAMIIHIKDQETNPNKVSKQQHQEDRLKKPEYGSRKKFFENIWERLLAKSALNQKNKEQPPSSKTTTTTTTTTQSGSKSKSKKATTTTTPKSSSGSKSPTHKEEGKVVADTVLLSKEQWEEMIGTNKLVSIDDLGLVPDSLFLAMTQMKPCFREEEEEEVRPGIDTSTRDDFLKIGVCCLHCDGKKKEDDSMKMTRRFFPTSTDMSQQTRVFQSMIEHVHTCTDVPLKVRKAMSHLLTREQHQREKEGKETDSDAASRRIDFFRRVWTRIQEGRDATALDESKVDSPGIIQLSKAAATIHENIQGDVSLLQTEKKRKEIDKDDISSKRKKSDDDGVAEEEESKDEKKAKQSILEEVVKEGGTQGDDNEEDDSAHKTLGDGNNDDESPKRKPAKDVETDRSKKQGSASAAGGADSVAEKNLGVEDEGGQGTSSSSQHCKFM